MQGPFGLYHVKAKPRNHNDGSADSVIQLAGAANLGLIFDTVWLPRALQDGSRELSWLV